MDYIEDNYDLSEPFQYPEPEPELVSTPEINEFIIRLSLILVQSKAPKNMLYALLYAVNFDVGTMLHCRNSMTEIAFILGISTVAFHYLVKKARKDFDIKHTNKSYTKPRSSINNMKGRKKPL
jgi:hypothetical protein